MTAYLALIALIFLPTLSQAQIVVSSGLTMRVAADNGEEKVLAVELTNSSDLPQRVSLELSDYINSCDSGYVYKKPGTQANSCSDWIALENQDILLAPREVSEVLLGFQVPEDYPHPSANSCLFVNNLPLVDTVQKQNVISFGIQIRYAVNILFSNPTKSSVVNLVAQELSLDSTETGYSFKLGYINMGNIASAFKVKLELVDGSGVLAYSSQTPPVIIQPEQCRGLFFDGVSVDKGQYQLVVIAETENGEMFALSEEVEL